MVRVLVQTYCLYAAMGCKVFDDWATNKFDDWATDKFNGRANTHPWPRLCLKKGDPCSSTPSIALDNIDLETFKCGI